VREWGRWGGRWKGGGGVEEMRGGGGGRWEGIGGGEGFRGAERIRVVGKFRRGGEGWGGRGRAEGERGRGEFYSSCT